MLSAVDNLWTTKRDYVTIATIIRGLPMGYEMKLTGLTLLLVLLLVCVAWAGDCGKCHSQRESACKSCDTHQACDSCTQRHACSDCKAKQDPCGKCRPKQACEPCGKQPDCRCKPKMREGCLPIPLPKSGCWAIDPNCCPRAEYTLCCEREEFKLLCPKKCLPQRKCHSCQKCSDECVDGIDLESSLDND